MKKSPFYAVMAVLALSPALFAKQVQAEDWAISATGSCKTALGTTIFAAGGIRASGGTAVVTCPLTKEVGTDTLNNVYARMRRNNAFGPDPFCNVSTISHYGSPSDISIGFAANTTNNQSINIPLPDQYSIGYADVSCVLNAGDTLYGIRYRQAN